MSLQIDPSVRYQKTHEWTRQDNGELVIGISDHAQDALSDIVFLELPRVGTKLARGERFGTIESVKAASDVYMPVTGVITATNSGLETTPEVINKAPYEAGWLIKVKPDNIAEFDALLDATAYEQFLKEEEH
jgi:glycine cleavage system H protein